MKLSAASLLCTIAAAVARAELPTDYQSWTAAEKEAKIMENILDTAGTNGKYPSPWDYLKILMSDISPTMDLEWDEVVDHITNKGVHPVGAVCSAKFQAKKNPYTGSFQGNDHTIIRLSVAAEPTDKDCSTGIGVKFLLGGVRSTNFVAMYGLDGQGSDGNFFLKTFSNHIPRPGSFGLKIGLKKFETVTEDGTKVGLSDIARYDPREPSTRIKDEEVKFPYKITLVPNTELSEQFDGVRPKDAMESLTEIGEGVKLYDMYAFSGPEDEEGIIVGSFTTTSPFYTTSYGDLKLFYQHQRIEEDWELRPDYQPATLRRLTKCPYGHG